MLLRKLRYLRLSIFLIYRPEPDQFILVNSAVRPFAKLQFALDFARKYFQCRSVMIRKGDFAQRTAFLSMLI
jgi:hypothetical protein